MIFNFFRLIDFAHTFELAEEKRKFDDNFLHGLKNLIEIFKHLHKTNGDKNFKLK